MKPAVLILTSSYPRFAGDPSGHFVQAEARGWVRRGAEVTVWAAGRGESVVEGPLQVRWLGGQGLFGHPGVVPTLSKNPARALWAVPAFVRLQLWRRQLPRPPDRVIAHWLPWGWIAAHAFPTGAAVETVLHGTDVRLFNRLPSTLRSRMLNELKTRGVVLRFVSRALREELARAVPPKLHSFVTQSVVEPAAIEMPRLPDRVALRHQLGLSPQKRVAVLVSRLVRDKRIDRALASLSLVPHLEVFVVGDGPDRALLAEKYPEVTFLGALPRQETLGWIKAADLLVSASRSEGAPTSIREARLIGTPVVSCNASDLRRWAQGDHELYVVD